MPDIAVEFHGIPRLRTGARRIELRSSTAREALETLGSIYPNLIGTVLDPTRGWIHASFAISLNGDRFLSHPDVPLSNGDVLLLLSADVGG